METTEQIRTKEYRKSNEEKDSGVNIRRPKVTTEKGKNEVERGKNGQEKIKQQNMKKGNLNPQDIGHNT